MTEQGWGVPRIARALLELMDVLGYDRFGAQGGDWGARISREIGMRAPDRMSGIHLNTWLPPRSSHLDATEQHEFSAACRAAVDAFYQAALRAGGRDNGAPGLRPHYHDNYYGAFVFDHDGNNVEAVCHKPA